MIICPVCSKVFKSDMAYALHKSNTSVLNFFLTFKEVSDYTIKANMAPSSFVVFVNEKIIPKLNTISKNIQQKQAPITHTKVNTKTK